MKAVCRALLIALNSEVMCRSRLLVVLLACLTALPGLGVLAQEHPSSTHKKKSTSTHKSASSAQKPTAHKHKTLASSHHHHYRHRKKVTAARAHHMKRTFVASSDLRPMARQLVEFRTPSRRDRGWRAGLVRHRLRALSRCSISRGNHCPAEGAAADRGAQGLCR